MSDHPGPPTLSLVRRCVVGATVEGGARTGLLSVVRPHDDTDAATVRAVPFPTPRRPLDDGPSAA